MLYSCYHVWLHIYNTLLILVKAGTECEYIISQSNSYRVTKNPFRLDLKFWTIDFKLNRLDFKYSPGEYTFASHDWFKLKLNLIVE